MKVLLVTLSLCPSNMSGRKTVIQTSGCKWQLCITVSRCILSEYSIWQPASPGTLTTVTSAVCYSRQIWGLTWRHRKFLSYQGTWHSKDKKAEKVKIFFAFSITSWAAGLCPCPPDKLPLAMMVFLLHLLEALYGTAV